MIKIWSDVHCQFAASHMVSQLRKLGHEAMTIKEWSQYDDSLHILYQVSNKYNLPKNYILMQTEPYFSHWFNAHYYQTIDNALAVCDYSEDNQQAYEHKNKFIITPGISPQPHGIKTIENLFYGWVEGSKRREEKIREIRKAYKYLRTETNTCGLKMWSLLSRTRKVFNIHYYDNSPLELYRLHESLSFGCEVYLWDEQRYYTEGKDNFEEIKHALNQIGLW